MKIGLPTGGSVPGNVLVERAQLAESMGVDYFFAHNRMAPFDRDTFVRLTLLATNTERMIIGAPSLSPFLCHPVSAARAIAAIDELAPGRVRVGWVPGSGIGLGSLGLSEQARRPLKPVREAIELSKLLLSGHIPPGAIEESDVRTIPVPDEFKINYQGEHFQFMNNVLMPSRKVPVMLASFAPNMLKLGGEIADEVITGWFANEGGNDWAIDQITEGAARSGRTLNDIKVHRAIHLAVWPDRQVAQELITQISQVTLLLAAPYRKRFGIKLPFETYAGETADRSSEAFRYGFGKAMAAYSGSTELAREIPIETHLELVVAGTPDDCIEQLQDTVVDPRFEALHVALFVPPPEEENWPKALELLMKEVVPALKITAG